MTEREFMEFLESRAVRSPVWKGLHLHACTVVSCAPWEDGEFDGHAPSGRTGAAIGSSGGTSSSNPTAEELAIDYLAARRRRLRAKR